MEEQFLTFKTMNQVFGINIMQVREILEYSNVTSIPNVPKWIKGVLNLRGNVVPLIDIGYRFGWDPSIVQNTTCIIICDFKNDSENVSLGVMVDSVQEVVDINESNRENTPNFGSNIRTDFISGIGKLNDQFIVLLNIEKVLDIDELGDFSEQFSNAMKELS